ncbi:outer membrane protein [Psychromonas sp. CNPT3]|uniref:DUF2608 domain-containing protein n=1 Tax=Psychromonas sp. CNPT3 TaxID=314282 RepID=UPI00006EA031|nr:DUF2608 domain-containing protein [Psychromonas sp. CNPT3]AGH81500.1 outer membrane protein [Psychromonas sp. CNPT3]
MKHPIKNACISLFCLSFAFQVNAGVQKKEISHFKDAMQTVQAQNKLHGIDNVLLILDIDNNLLTSESDIGGDIWYQWQRGKLAVKATDEQKVDCLFQDSIGLLYELGTMRLIEKDVPSIVANWQKQGNTVIALTSRSPLYRTATERELTRVGIDFDGSSLKVKGQKETPVFRDMLKRPTSYMKGVFMTTGQNKGEMIKYLLDKTGQKFDSIIFVDDTQKNVDNVYNAFKDSKDTDMYIFHYTKVEEDRIAKNGATLTQQQANEMASDWKALQKTLKSIFPGRVNNGQCLGQ